MSRLFLRGVVVSVAGAGVVGLALAALLLVAAVLSAIAVPGPLEWIERRVNGHALWLAFGVTAFATAGSLFFSEGAHFTPCELCWYQRLCMYPLAPITLVMAARDARRWAVWVMPLAIAGAALSTYHVLIEQGLAPQTMGCLLSLPGGCALKWINEFGFVTIPTLALTAFVLATELLGLAARVRTETAVPAPC